MWLMLSLNLILLPGRGASKVSSVVHKAPRMALISRIRDNPVPAHIRLPMVT